MQVVRISMASSCHRLMFSLTGSITQLYRAKIPLRLSNSVDKFIEASVPAASNTTSAPFPSLRSLTTFIGSSVSIFTVTSAPSSRASLSFPSKKSIPTTVLAPFRFAPWTITCPANPSPTTATTSPISTPEWKMEYIMHPNGSPKLAMSICKP